MLVRCEEGGNYVICIKMEGIKGFGVDRLVVFVGFYWVEVKGRDCEGEREGGGRERGFEWRVMIEFGVVGEGG